MVEPAPTEKQLATMDEIARQFMEQSKVPGMSVVIARHRQFIYEKGFGYADVAAHEPVTLSHLFRIASVSKSITPLPRAQFDTRTIRQ